MKRENEREGEADREKRSCLQRECDEGTRNKRMYKGIKKDN